MQPEKTKPTKIEEFSQHTTSMRLLSELVTKKTASPGYEVIAGENLFGSGMIFASRKKETPFFNVQK